MSSTLAGILAALPEDERRDALRSLPASDLKALEYAWPVWARHDQLPPKSDWRCWLLLGGRGSGKTRSASEWVRAKWRVAVGARWALSGPTANSTRRIMVEGPSGILAVAPEWCRPIYEPSTRRITYPNGGVIHLFSAEEPNRLRGPNLNSIWVDEIASFPDPEVWDMAQMALRIPGPKGHAPCVVVTTTPKMQALLKAIIAAPSTVVTRARTSDNAGNLDSSTLAYLQDKYGGTPARPAGIGRRAA